MTTGQSSDWIPAELLIDCRLCASRSDLVGLLPMNGRVAEVGVERGRFSQHILQASNPRELHLIDLDFSQLDHALRLEPRATLHEAASDMTLATFPDNYFDWIYIDADHSYRGVALDAAAAEAKVRPGGYLVFNDFAHADPFLGAYGVHRAVVDFTLRARWPWAWFAYEPSALYDVALRKPL
jgi:SAM-dependent methyltransferase